ncbi:hypothetical protein BGZ57DRAFT_935974 [Hyaloscypha finlandica]|nr:hypothetical protein BGZ57DRAFT_935974 [Hyaloscypha finlandica]
MAPLRKFLLLFLVGFASTSILRRQDVDVKTTAVRSAAQSTSVDISKGIDVGVRSDPNLGGGILLSSQVITSAYWVLEYHVTRGVRDALIMDEWSCPDLDSTNVATALVQDSSTTDRFFGHTEFTLSGFGGSGGTAEIIVKFTASVWGSPAYLGILKMINPPTCTIGGANQQVTSWSFDQSK